MSADVTLYVIERGTCRIVDRFWLGGSSVRDDVEERCGEKLVPHAAGKTLVWRTDEEVEGLLVLLGHLDAEHRYSEGPLEASLALRSGRYSSARYGFCLVID